jgi:F420-dependent oxidoreductase-like protein
MRVCLMIEGQEGVTWDEWLALARAAEEHGYEALMRSDHYLGIGSGAAAGALDAWGTICALATQTTRIRLGTLVSPATFRHPSNLAKLAVTADHISGGRVDLGMGTGWYEAEHAAYGFPFGSMRERMDVLAEQLEIVRRSWDPGPFSFDGRHYRVQDLDALPKPVGRPRLIMGGAAKPRAAALAARWADEYNVLMVSPQEAQERIANVRRACEEAGRDPATMTFSLMTEFDRSADELRAYAEVGIERVMLQHLDHRDLDAIARVAREVIG